MDQESQLDPWHARWREGRIGFHLDQVNPALLRQQHRIQESGASTVLVPLCGKSVDLWWLADACGLQVIGVECSSIAIKELFDERGVAAMTTNTEVGPVSQHGAVSVVETDIFNFRPQTPIDLIYDRAALIALPAGIRTRYVAHLAECTGPNTEMLLVTLAYDQKEMDGPPFSVPHQEVQQHFGHRGGFQQLEDNDSFDPAGRFAQNGLTAMRQHTYWVGGS